MSSKSPVVSIYEKPNDIRRERKSTQAIQKLEVHLQYYMELRNYINKAVNIIIVMSKLLYLQHSKQYLFVKTHNILKIGV